MPGAVGQIIVAAEAQGAGIQDVPDQTGHSPMVAPFCATCCHCTNQVGRTGFVTTTELTSSGVALVGTTHVSLQVLPLVIVQLTE
jgi:hypothetical protein